ncbi:MAG: oxygen-insensitive NADPH nitroreductase [Methylocystaceae bacterium]|nr:oxygen-insensitive NADPH nitroreductase [Methylocystaceae bacterium]
MNAVIELIRNHRSIRKFKDKPVSADTIKELVLSGQSASTSSFIQAYTVIQIKDVEKRKLLAQYAGNQIYVEEAPEFFVFCADLNRIKYCCSLHNQEMEAEYTEHFISASVDTGLFAQNFVIAAESLGLGCVYIGGLRNNPQDVADLLNLPDHVYPVFGMCLGYPDQNPEIKPRLPIDAVFYQDEYPREMDCQVLKEYDEEILDYYATRNTGNKIESWSEQIALKTTKKCRPFMKKFLNNRGFLLK